MTPSDWPDPDASASQLQADIDRTRRELGDTVEALSEKLDVKSRVKGTAGQVKENSADLVGRASHQARAHWPQIAVVAVTAIAMGVVWRRLG